MCECYSGKIPYPTQQDAWKAACHINRKRTHGAAQVYLCPYCNQYHLKRKPRKPNPIRGPKHVVYLQENFV